MEGIVDEFTAIHRIGFDVVAPFPMGHLNDSLNPSENEWSVQLKDRERFRRVVDDVDNDDDDDGGEDGRPAGLVTFGPSSPWN